MRAKARPRSPDRGGVPRVLPWVLALAVVGTTPLVAEAQAVRGDGIAATVGGGPGEPSPTVILHSDVELAARLAIAAASGDAFALEVLPARVLGAALDGLVGEALIAREAARVEIARATAEDRAREHARIAATFGGEDGLARFLERAGATEDELRRLETRRAVVSVFLRASVAGGEVVRDDEVERAYAAGEHPFGDAPLDEVREPLRALLLRQRLEAAVARWVSVLRSRSRVRIVAPYGRRASPAVYPGPRQG